ncbi:ultraviolet-B receptor UVR8-like isoform X2 [Amphibalanus amphitrite]|uniref:ultraviolet-B receptor UVR8-like isoform X2 n=1 Tax=Amphibalanus amphitrite TaxID=1232801 RepID=UPI001C90010D|nr:ultraviolet-B receptor UVR8-like isoform X2 [Amphibalanus amphitrite]
MDEPVVSVACGWDHTVLLTTSGQLLTAGGIKFGQQGTGYSTTTATKANATTNATVKASANSASPGHSGLSNLPSHGSNRCGFVPLVLPLDRNGDVKGSDGGTNQKASGGTVTSSDKEVTSRDEDATSEVNKQLLQGKATSFSDEVTPQNEAPTSQETAETSRGEVMTSQHVRVTSVAAGLRHTVAVTSDGRLFVWGDNSRGQLGVPVERLIASPRALPTPSAVCGASCGQRHTMILCRSESDGSDTGGKLQLYGMGDNRRGQICGKIIPATPGSPLVNTTGDVTPARLDGPSLVCLPDDVSPTRVHCGWTHTIVECADSHLRGWGRSDYNQLNIPRCPISSLACGSEHCLSITKDGRLLAWGWDEHGAAAGQLGKTVKSVEGKDVTSVEEKGVMAPEESSVTSVKGGSVTSKEAECVTLKETGDVTTSVKIDKEVSASQTAKEVDDSMSQKSKSDNNLTSQKSKETHHTISNDNHESSQKANNADHPTPQKTSQISSPESSAMDSPESKIVDVTPWLKGKVVAVGAGYGCSFVVCLVDE